MPERVYLDWNASAPLRPEARAAMLEAMDVVGNPSSVHAEGRAARAIVEKARGQVAALVGATNEQIVFTSGATEAVGLADDMHYTIGSALEHDAVYGHLVEPKDGTRPTKFTVGRDGLVDLCSVKSVAQNNGGISAPVAAAALIAAQSETGVLQPMDKFFRTIRSVDEEFKIHPREIVVDAVQAVGRIPFSFSAIGADFGLLSGHKLGSAKGVGALYTRTGENGSRFRDCAVQGSQEKGRRSGTENVIGIAGFGAAAEAALRDLEAGVWERVEKLRNILEEALATASKETIFVAQAVERLPNTSCFITPGWKGETQVMQMDLAGYAVSAGSACSSGKVKESRVLRAMGFDPVEASSAIRVSLGPTTTETEVLGFARTWGEQYRRWRDRRVA